MNKSAGGPRDPLVFVFFNEIGIIEQLARNLLERALPAGLKQPHFGVLNHLVRLGDDKSPLFLSRAFQVSNGTMTNTLQRLEARGQQVPGRGGHSMNGPMLMPGMLTPDEIAAAISGADVRKSETGGYYHVTVRRQHNGRDISRSLRIDTDATDSDMERLKEQFQHWKDEEGISG